MESLAVAVLASAAGVLVASWSADALLTLLPSDFPLVPSVGSLMSQPRVLAFTIAVTLVAALVFGLVPAIRCRR